MANELQALILESLSNATREVASREKVADELLNRLLQLVIGQAPAVLAREHLLSKAVAEMEELHACIRDTIATSGAALPRTPISLIGRVKRLHEEIAITRKYIEEIQRALGLKGDSGPSLPVQGLKQILAHISKQKQGDREAAVKLTRDILAELRGLADKHGIDLLEEAMQ